MIITQDFLFSIEYFWKSPNKYGYWYLVTLAVYYISLSVFRFNRKNRWYIDVLLAIFIWSVYFVLWKLFGQMTDCFCMLNSCKFFPFFILGAFSAKYNLLEMLKKNKWLFSLCIVGYIVLFYVDMPLHVFDSLNKNVLLPLCMVVIVIMLFLRRQNKSSFVERILEYVGRKTLDVYVIHYFFINYIHLKKYANVLMILDNSLLTFLLVLFLSIGVTFLAIFVGNILHYAKWIEKVVYGR